MASEPTHRISEPTHKLNDSRPEPEVSEAVPSDAEPAPADPLALSVEAEAPPQERPLAEHPDGSETPPEEDPLPEPAVFHHEPRFVEPPPQSLSFEATPQAASFAQLPPITPTTAAPPAGDSVYATPYPWATPPATATPVRPEAMLFGFPLKNVLMVAVPLCIVAVVAAFLLMNNPALDTAPSPAPPVAVSVPTSAPAASLNSGAGRAVTPAAAPVTLSAGTSASTTPPDSGTDGSASTGSLVGRWEAKSGDFYEFRGDGSGVRGSSKSGKGVESFTWTVTNNHVNLAVEQGVEVKQETLAFSFGPDHKSLFLRQPDGHTREFSLSADAPPG